MSIADQHLTDSVRNAWADARAQGGQTSDWMPYLPASTSPYAPEGIDPSTLTWAETVAPGGYTHKVVARGTRIRFDDPTGDARVAVIGWGANPFTPLLLLYRPLMGLTAAMVEAMFGMYAIGLIPGLLVAGRVSDRIGRRPVVECAVLLSIVAGWC